VSISSRARRVHRRLPWRKYQRIQDDLKRIRPEDEDQYVSDAYKDTATSFVELVAAVQTLARVRRDAARDRLDASPHGEEDALRGLLVAIDEESLMRLQTLYYFRTTSKKDPALLHAELSTRARKRDAAIETLLSAPELDESLELAIERLRKAGIDPIAGWHQVVPRDYVKDPPTWLHLRTPGRMTSREFAEILPPSRGTEFLVGAMDPETGPYSSCLRVAGKDVKRWLLQGFRELGYEEEFGEIEDFTRDWKHSE
jgi:hypothetical protein